ncbi:putative toxin-antitoxin system, toxin component [Roseibium sp. TrichSKD4]|uniref:nucleotidyltransferase family protein n=1 Tax=Roseibium sp. TrichSKD4 TaxID=744980 RepID=UPI0001E565E8|nr:nucleotidyltransferase domain-containing protein [Roseibium sp. TrichSKD4]EFO34023.1 putative toxin-antitoxin system, toxin component [Roseibium sp. TrichSKD4]
MPSLQPSKPEQQTAYLSARVPVALKNRFKALAAERGAKVQDLLQKLVNDYVAGEGAQTLSATDIIARLRSQKEELQKQGIAHLYLFGSVARGSATASSDIDLSYVATEGTQLSLFDIGRFKQVLEEVLECSGKVDLSPRSQLADHVWETASSDEIQVF